MELTVFRLLRTGGAKSNDRTNMLGRGVQFPDGSCYLFWNREAFPKHQQLEGEHMSKYDCLDDVEKVTNGKVTEVKNV